MNEKRETAPTSLKVRTGLTAGGVTIYGTDWCGFTTKQKKAFDEAGIPYTYVNCDADKGKCSGITSFPTVQGWPTPNDHWMGFRSL